MNIRTWPWMRAFLVVVLVAVVALVASAVLIAQLPLDQMSITIDGERADVHGLAGRHAVALVVFGAVALISAVFLVAVAVVLALLAAALGIAVAAVAAVASMLVALSPLLLAGWLVWRALRAPPVVITAPVAAPVAS